MKGFKTYSIALLCTAAFCGCTVTSHVTSYNAFDRAINKVAEEIKQEGFSLESSEKKDIRDIPLSVRASESYSPDEHGFQGSNATGVSYSNTYSFKNSNGETMSYTVSYRTGVNPKQGVVYVTDVSIDRCETSNSAHYERLCGKSAPIHMLTNLEKDTTTVL